LVNVAVSLTTYQPRFQRQLVISDPYGKFNCSAYSLAMEIDYATTGGLPISGKEIRALSSEPKPDPASPGLNIAQLVEVAKKLRVPIADQTGKPIETLVTYLKQHQACIVQGDSGVFVPKYQENPFDGPHAVLITDIDQGADDLWVWNPLNSSPRLIPLAVVRAYALGLKVPNTAAGIRFAVGRPSPIVATYRSA
jgi:hypothetical protein